MAPDDRDDQTRSFIALTKGAMVSHYRIIEKIGAGGMGEVYLAGMYYFARQYEESLRHYSKTIDLDPYYVPVYLHLAAVHADRGDHEKARAAIQKASSLLGEDVPALNIHLAWISALTGDRDDAERALQTLNELSEQEFVSPLEIAAVYLALSQSDEVFKWIDKAVEERIPWTIFLRAWLLCDRLRSDQRFAAVLKKIGFA